MTHGLQILRVNRGQRDAVNARNLAVPGITRTTINAHPMTPGGKSDAELFGKRLESAVSRGHTASSDDGDGEAGPAPL